MSKRIVPGLNIQWPWSRMIVEGQKVIETRGYQLPIQYVGIPIAIIETPGPLGKKQGIDKARIVGLVTFSESFQYKTKAQWKSDTQRHFVKEDSAFAFGNRSETWAWVISEVSALKKPAPAPARRGIVFTKSCSL